nr:SEC-C metal-binding domain-containing protein [Denitrovibrio acetiphilus]
MEGVILPSRFNPARHLNGMISELLSGIQLEDNTDAQKAASMIMESYNAVSDFFMSENENFIDDAVKLAEKAVDSAIEYQKKKGLIDLLNQCRDSFDFILDCYEEELAAMTLSKEVLENHDIHNHAEMCDALSGTAIEAVADLSRKGERAAYYRQIAVFIMTNLIMMNDAANTIRLSKTPKPASEPAVKKEKVGRNEPCPCGSGKKYKKCCGRNDKVVYL